MQCRCVFSAVFTSCQHSSSDVAAFYCGEEGWKQLCERDDIDLV